MDANATLALNEALADFVRVLGLDDMVPANEIEAALRDIEARLLLIASEAFSAELGGTSLAEAATDYERFPHLARLHASVEDIITLELPRVVALWARRFLTNAPVDGLEALRSDLVRRAKSDPMPLRRALFRALLFEGVRLNLVIRARLFPDEVFGVGLEHEDLDAIALSEVDFWLSSLASDDAEVRPFTVMVAAACEVLGRQAESLRISLQTVKRELREALAARARVEAALATMNAPNALIVRNAHAAEFEVQPLTIEMLRERHPTAFGGVKRGALYQRKTEMEKRRKAGGPLIRRRKRVALLDLVAEQIGITETEAR